MLLIEQALLEDLINPIEIESTNYEYNGVKVPRVTDILSKTIHEDYLMTWANSLGFRRITYKDELTKAANIGTIIHSSIENYLKFNKLSDLPAFNAFLLWWNDISENNSIKILGQEEKLVCNWFGGTYDLLLSINDRIYLVDFKTSNHISFKYCLQLAAYRYMLYTIKNINIDGCVILQLDKKEAMYEEYLLDFSIQQHHEFIEHCAKTFLSLVYAYYNTQYTKEMYNCIFLR